MVNNWPKVIKISQNTCFQLHCQSLSGERPSGVRTEMSQLGSAELEQPLSYLRTSGPPKSLAANFASSTPTWSRICSMDAKYGGRKRQCSGSSSHLSTHVASSTSDGQRRSRTKICGSEQDRNLWPRQWGWMGYTLRNPASSITRQALEFHREKDKEASLATVGRHWGWAEATRLQLDSSKQQEQPIRKRACERPLMAYFPLRAIRLGK